MESIEVELLSPLRLWTDFVSKRKPVLIDGQLQEDEWKASEKWNFEYLKQRAGECNVFVEYRQSTEEAFGKGKRQKMQFSEFLNQLESGSENLYLTPQPTILAEDGFPELLSAPLTHLSDDFGFRPKLLGHLIPHQVNLWLGSSQKGAMSGLHHDYHDNLYILLKGSKHFLLFPPETAPTMYTYGEINCIHNNGRIVYKGQGDVLSDGSDALDVVLWLRNKQNKQTDNAANSEEADLEAALYDFENAQDDYESSSKTSNGSTNHEHHNKRQKMNASQLEEEETEPPSFSRIDMSLSDDVLTDRYPNFPGRSSAIECTVHEGQMLYLPAGWFHNVTSVGKEASGSNIHIALNYWCYPADNIIHENTEQVHKAFHQPYLSDYWSETLNHRFN
eukprot:g5439.t1